MKYRGAVLCLLLACLVAFAAHVPAAALEDTAAVRRIVEAGALETALARIDALQPRDVISATWAEWEGLRCDLLARLSRHAQLLVRVSALPAGAATASLNACLVAAARAAVLQNEPRLARDYAA